ncbi:MAG: trypsin-like peptidase domain-containing protein [Bacteroidota bacterium]
MKQLLSYILVSVAVSGLSIAGYHFSGLGQTQAESVALTSSEASSPQDPSFTFEVNHPMPNLTAAESLPVSFTPAAEASMPAVVHIKSIKTRARANYDPFYELFGMRPRQQNSRQQTSSGSGVIIGADGYIVTNNHVIEDADELDVTLYDNRTFKAKVIGTDPSTDLGLIKIEGFNLPTMDLVNSDEVRVGEWVLAVGNPFSLSSTVTAGIVSAIGRDLEIIKDRMAIESFIQTDAAVNPGNSGGALVNLNGQLIGVNTAIASPTGTYAGYAFAVPANIVKKVVSDLKEFGTVQRGFLGITSAKALDGDLARQLGTDLTEGVVVEGTAEISGARKAGLRNGDIIVSIDDVEVRNEAKLLELIGRNRPGDVINVKFERNGSLQRADVQLTDQYGNTTVDAVGRSEVLNDIGIELRDLTPRELDRIGINTGVLVAKLTAGKLRSQTSMKENFVIMRINDEQVRSSGDVTSFLESVLGRISLTGFYPGSNRLYNYEFEL